MKTWYWLCNGLQRESRTLMPNRMAMLHRRRSWSGTRGKRRRSMRRPAKSAGGTLFLWSTQLMGCLAKQHEPPRGGSRVFWLPNGIGSTVRCVALFGGELHFQLQGPPHCSCGVIGRLLGRGELPRMGRLPLLLPGSESTKRIPTAIINVELA